jgi:conjugal transfer pilus assembly protein TraD
MLSLLIVPAAGVAAALWLRSRGLHWTWALAAAAAAYPLTGTGLGLAPLAAAAVAGALGARWHGADVRAGGDLARTAAQRTGPLHAVRVRRGRHAPVIDADGMLVGFDERGAAARIPFGAAGGSHTLVVGATGSGKTVTQCWIAVRAIDAGCGAVVIDPKGDGLLREQLILAAARAGRDFIEWTPDGGATYNPYGHGSDGEIADKALAAEHYSEPHYQRQAQRYLGHAVRAMRVAGVAVTPATLLEHLDPLRLEVLARGLPEQDARTLCGYLDSLTPRQARDLAGTRDRLAILAESDLGRWLDPALEGSRPFELLEAVRGGAVVMFRLDADRRPLLAQMLAAAIVQDLLTISAELQAAPVATIVAIDEFSALASERVARLLGRARSAGLSCVLATQELFDLRATRNEHLLEQVLGNVAAVVAHRQSVPDSAELVAGIAGTRGAWISSERVGSGVATRSRGREYLIHPDQIKALPRGVAAVVVPERGRASIARIRHPHSHN